MPKRLLLHPWKHLRVDLVPESGIAWYFMQPGERPSFTPGLLDEIRLFQHSVKALSLNQDESPILYTVLASDCPGVFNFGGDLDLFARLICDKDRVGLEYYAKACIDVLYANAVNLDLPITTISLVEGQALGGGFEAALSSEVVIAERGSMLGFPEILFNLFPGMGAFHLLTERVSPVQAKRIMQGGDLYSAETLYDMGLVDILVERGEGRKAVMGYIRRQSRSRNGHVHIQKVASQNRAFGYQALLNAADVWVDAALAISDRDVRKMQKLVSAQRRVVKDVDVEVFKHPSLA